MSDLGGGGGLWIERALHGPDDIRTAVEPREDMTVRCQHIGDRDAGNTVLLRDGGLHLGVRDDRIGQLLLRQKVFEFRKIRVDCNADINNDGKPDKVKVQARKGYIPKET